VTADPQLPQIAPELLGDATQDADDAYRNARRFGADPDACMDAAINAAAPTLFAAALLAERTQFAALDSAMHSVWLHGNWWWLTRNMTTPEKEAAADAVDRYTATRPPWDRGLPVDRWWRENEMLTEEADHA
jgi:hypothetical protein